MDAAAWAPNAPSVVSEIIDGELVVINLETGSYYSSLGIGSWLWRCFEQRIGREVIEAAIVDAFGVGAGQARSDLEAFTAELRRENLIRESAPADATRGDVPALPAGNYMRPEIKVFSDMQDLLLLDPIHDVSDEGWPTRAVDSSS